MLIKNITIAVLLSFCCYTSATEPQRVLIGNFSSGDFDGWQKKEFNGETQYQFITLNSNTVLRAKSQNSASGLYKKTRVDLSKYPYLNWRWRIENRLETQNEQIKSGDDYAARIYVIVSGGLLIWRARALNYVWANASPKYGIWQNAFAGKKAMMMALRSKQDETSTWFVEKRNVLDDLKTAFGSEIHHIDAVAVMTDTDNNGGHATSYIGDIFFSSQ